jgi:glycolate oxidase iron-sulfur subunit
VKLRVDEDELASCVACGLCLPHCPTYRVSGEEQKSPRGRIAAMRAVHWGDAEADDVFANVMDECVQCLGCQAACPSNVPFGRLLEGAQQAIPPPWWKRVGYWTLGHHRLLVGGSKVLAVAQRLRLVPSKRFGLPRIPLRQPTLRPSGGDVYLFTGCVMDAWMRETHAAVQRVLEATGAGVALAASGADCCGALHVHAGLHEQAERLGERTLAAMPGDAPILVDSAGCGARLKEIAPDRVRDVHEWLAERIDSLPEPRRRFPTAVAVQDPCHLRHVQKVHGAVRTVLGRYAELAELDDEGLCCGAGGAYSVFQPELSGRIRERKVEAIGRTGAPVVASANPGCAMHLGAVGLDVRHPLEIVDEVMRDSR